MSPARFAAAALLLLSPALLVAQKKKGNKNDQQQADPAARATVLHNANLYVIADGNDPAIATIAPGHEIVIMQRNGAWVNVFANTDEKEEQDPDSEPEFKDPNQSNHQYSGWIHDQGVVGPTTPNGDAILFGAAAEFEAQAAQPHPPKDAAQEAHLLYQRVVDYFPDSPLAPEAAWRSADIRWQLGKLDISTLPSAHEQDAYLRPQLYENALRRVMKMYPDTPYAARAAFDLIDEKLCGDWQGLPKCPEMETQLYLKYADRYPDGPKSAEALYDAAYRQGVLVTMYSVDDDKKNSDKAAQNCQAIADELRQKYPKSDYAARAESIAYRVKQGIPIYGSDRD
jgi:outer membrane protein assembly factor BamD (BamD/ComL family)